MTGPDPAERIRRLITAPQSGTGRLTGLLAATVTAVVPLLPALVALAPAVLFVDTAHL